jgi:hypothetical protein
VSPPGSDDDFFNVGRTQEEGNDDTGRLIRPYAMTRGRTAADVEDISLEAQLQTTALGQAKSGSYRWEAAKILQLAVTPMALIEVAARAEIPIGVARVILADLVADGTIAVQRITTPASTATYRNLLERVLDGVRSL